MEISVEKVPIARKQINLASSFDCDGAIPVRLQLVLPEFTLSGSDLVQLRMRTEVRVFVSAIESSFQFQKRHQLFLSPHTIAAIRTGKADGVFGIGMKIQL